jgi:lipopolysaccharide export system protein LptA
MSTVPSHRTRTRIELLALFVTALCACGFAQARQSDKDQPIHVRANTFAGSQDSGKIVFIGSFHMDQGTFQADGAKATGYTDPDDTSQWQRVVVTGDPAHFQQTQDNGTLVHGQAATIDYKVSENTVLLTGNASVVQQGRGEFHGEKLVYNTDSGEIQGSPTTGGQVHITLQPRSKPASTAAEPASTSAPAASAPANAPAPASTSAPAPAPASTTGTH